MEQTGSTKQGPSTWNLNEMGEDDEVEERHSYGNFEQEVTWAPNESALSNTGKYCTGSVWLDDGSTAGTMWVLYNPTSPKSVKQIQFLDPSGNLMTPKLNGVAF